MAIIPTSGEFTKVPEGAGSGAFVITATAGVFDNPVSYNDIRAAVDAGQIVFIISKKGEKIMVMYLESVSAEFGYDVGFTNGVRYAGTSADAPLTLSE